MPEDSVKNADKARQVMTQGKSLSNRRASWEKNVESAMELVMPHRAKMSVDTSMKNYSPSRNRKDGTATASLQLLANGLLGNVCSQKSTWFKLNLENTMAEKASGVGQWLDDVTSVFYHIFNQSSFYSGAWQIFTDAGGSGLGQHRNRCLYQGKSLYGVMYVGENLKKQSVDFVPYHPKGCYLATDARGVVDTHFHKFVLSARDIVKDYGKENLTKDFVDKAKKNPWAMFELTQAVFPREDRDIYKMDAINKEYASLHVLHSGQKLCRESGYDSFPYSIWRYEHASDDEYPWSPTLTGYPDIDRLNKISKATTDVAQLAAQPPFVVPPELHDSFEIKPRFKLKAFDMNRIPVQLGTFGTGYPISVDREQHYQEMVKQHYFTNFFLMLSAASGQNMTATQVLEMQGEKATVIGGMVSRLTQEFFDPLFDRVFMIAARNGWIPEPPEALLELGGQVAIDYIGPLPMAQKRLLEINGPVNALQNFLPLTEVWPELRHIIKPYDLGKKMLVSGGMPHAITRTEKEFNQIVQQEQRDQQAAAEAEMENKAADTYNKGAKSAEPGSASEALLAGGQ